MTGFPTRSSYSRLVLTTSIALVFITIRVFEINEPWIGIHDFQGALFSLISRNIEHYGFLNTSFGPVISWTGDQFYYYLHHPHLLWILGAFMCRILGDHEWVYRIISISFSAGTLILLHRLVKRLWDRDHAIVAIFFYSLIPMDAYYSRGYSYETAVSFFLLLMTLLYLNLLETNRDRYYFLILIVFLLAGMIGWPTYYILPMFAIHYHLYAGPGRESIQKALLFILAGILLFLLFVLYTRFLTDSWTESGLLEGFINRSGIPIGEVGKKSYSLRSFILRQGERSFRLLTPVAILLAFAWLYDAFKSFGASMRRSTAHCLVLMFVMVAVIHVALFLDGAWRHEYWLYYFVIPVSMASSHSVIKIQRILRKHHSILSTVFLAIVILTFGIESTWTTLKQHQLIEGEGLYRLSLHLRNDQGAGEGTIFYMNRPQPLIGRYYHYFGENVLNKPSPRIAYYLDGKLRWGVTDLSDLHEIISSGEFTRLVTRNVFYQKTMDSSIKAWLDENCQSSEYLYFRIYNLKDRI